MAKLSLLGKEVFFMTPLSASLGVKYLPAWNMVIFHRDTFDDLYQDLLAFSNLT